MTLSLNSLVGTIGSLLAKAVEPIFVALQRLLGIKRLPWVFLLPNLAAVVLFSLLPVFINVYYSISGSDRLYPTERPVIGLDNFEALARCQNFLDPSTCSQDLFWRALQNTVVFVPVQVVLMVLVSLLTAVVLNRDIRARGFFRGVFFFPVMLSPVVVALVWKWILQREGILNAAFNGMGLQSVEWLVRPDSAFSWAIAVTVWANMGFYTLILLAGLQAIPRDVYEAAKMDSASPWRQFTRITLPLLRPTMLVVVVLAVIRSVQTFDELYVLTGGGPGSATTLIIQYIYERGFAAQPRNFGLAAAASLVVGLVLLVLTILQMRLSRKSYNG